MYDVPGVPVISNCGTPTEKMSELSPETQNAFSETLHKRHQWFLEKKLKELGSAPQNVVLVTADVVRLYPNLGKFYLLPKILRRFYDAPGGPVISNWHTYKKMSELPPKTHNPCIYQNLT